MSQYQWVALLYVLILYWSSFHVYIDFFIEYPWFKQRHWISNRGHRLWNCDPHFILKCAADVTAILVFCAYLFSDTLNRWHVLLGLLVVTTVECVALYVRSVSLELGGTVVLIVGVTLGSTASSVASLYSSTSQASTALGGSSCFFLRHLVWQYWKIMLSFTHSTQSVSLGKCRTIVSNRFTILSFNIVRCSNSRLPLALRSTDVDYYVVYLV